MEDEFASLEKIVLIHGLLKSEISKLVKELQEQNKPLIETRFPMVDIFVSSDKIKIYADIPGVALDDFTVFMCGEFLIIEGEKKLGKIPYKVNFIRMERTQVEFRRVINLPHKVKKDNITAKLKNGILYIELCIDEDDQGKSI